MKNTIMEIFDKWIEGPVSHYGLAGNDINQSTDNNSKRDVPNLFLLNEADVRIKFGGFLDQKLLSSDGGLTVHSELNVSSDSEVSYFADLSIHDTSGECSLAENNRVNAADTVRAVIKVRLIDCFISNNKSYDHTEFHSDLACLSFLPDKVCKFLLIIEEGELMDLGVIDDLRKMARQCEITLLSNNEWLSSENF